MRGEGGGRAGRTGCACYPGSGQLLRLHPTPSAMPGAPPGPRPPLRALTHRGGCGSGSGAGGGGQNMAAPGGARAGRRPRGAKPVRAEGRGARPQGSGAPSKRPCPVTRVLSHVSCHTCPDTCVLTLGFWLSCSSVLSLILSLLSPHSCPISLAPRRKKSWWSPAFPHTQHPLAMVSGCKESSGQNPSSASSPVVSWNPGISPLEGTVGWCLLSI